MPARSPSLTLTLWAAYARGQRERPTWAALIDRLGVRDPEVVRDKRHVAGFSIASFEGE